MRRVGFALFLVGGIKADEVVQRPYDCHLSTKELKEIGVDVSAVKFRDWW